MVSNNHPVHLKSQTTVKHAKTVFVRNAKQQTVNVGTSHSRWVWLPNRSVRVTGKFVTKNQKLRAPMTTKQVVAKANLLVNGQQISYLRAKSDEIALTPTKKVERANVFVLAFRAIADLF
ncbi:hypothetical protein [Lentilactobacillus kosonis]|uniref:hypothetical protein n=1 Tax=Lentilactobacillus kosonis TaxID=2810561 RepID=UPI00350E57DE